MYKFRKDMLERLIVLACLAVQTVSIDDVSDFDIGFERTWMEAYVAGMGVTLEFLNFYVFACVRIYFY